MKPHAADDLATLLRQWSETQLAALDVPDQPIAEALRSGSLLRPPATEDAVRAAEERLGTRFPPSYHSFLLLSDGAYGDTMGVVTNPMPEERFGFLPAAEVRWFRELEPESVDMWCRTQDEIDEANGGPDLTPPFEGDEVRDHRRIRDALLIARGFDATWSLLVPVGEPGPEEEWEVWDHYKEGATRWSSFHAFLREAVEEQVGIDVDEDEARRLLAAAAAHDVRADLLVARIRSPEAAGVLMEAARGARPSAPMRALARIGGPDVVAFLADLEVPTWLESERMRALARIGTQDALDRLAAAGAFYDLARVGDPRAPGIALARLRASDDPSVIQTATSVLRELPDAGYVPDLLDAYERVSYDGTRVSLLSTLAACGAHDAVRRWAPDLLDGPYAYVARTMLDDLPDA
ncbi:SMI1/KNR4 family protein [Nocardioides albidus]|uniref:SMI1/KNR4 family protein n=1 Tax=Nocardioides albidus TaxID=1517589 RepID=UPI00186469C2|nr:SMI1/KNR4 family protein [Nocardioides albidus]